MARFVPLFIEQELISPLTSITFLEVEERIKLMRQDGVPPDCRVVGIYNPNELRMDIGFYVPDDLSDKPLPELIEQIRNGGTEQVAEAAREIETRIG